MYAKVLPIGNSGGEDSDQKSKRDPGHKSSMNFALEKVRPYEKL